MGEGLILGHVVAEHFQQLLVEDHDQRIDIGFEFRQAAVGIAHAPIALKLKGFGDHANRQDAHLARHPRDHRRRTGPGAAAHAGRDEQHVRAGDGTADVLLGHFSGFTTALGLAAGAQTAAAKLDRAVRRAAAQRLGVGIGAYEFDALHRRIDHVGHGVAAAAADTDHLDLRALVERDFFNHFDGHFSSPGVSIKLTVAVVVQIFFCWVRKADPCIAIANAGSAANASRCFRASSIKSFRPASP